MLGNLVVDLQTRISDLLLQFEKSKFGFALVTNRSGGMAGVVTDGDFRRATLKGIGLDQPVSEIMTSNFLSVMEGTPYPSVYKIARKNGISFIPILSNNGSLVGVHTVGFDVQDQVSFPSTAIIMAGGYGTRMGALTQAMPKPLLQVLGVPLIDYAIASLTRFGVSKIIVSLNYLGDRISEYLGDGDRYGVEVVYLREDSPLGTAGALSELSFDEPQTLIVANADVLHDFDLKRAYSAHAGGSADITICGVRQFTHVPYGVLNFDDAGKLISLTEKPSFSSIVSSGVYFVSSSSLEALTMGKATDITDLISGLIKNGRDVFVEVFDSYWRDVGNPESLRLASEELSVGTISGGGTS